MDIGLLIKHQRRDIKETSNYNKLSYNDLLRLSKKLQRNIFENECGVYYGERKKNTYIFSYKGKKTSLYKMLFINYKNNWEQGLKFVRKCDFFDCICLNHWSYEKN